MRAAAAWLVVPVALAVSAAGAAPPPAGPRAPAAATGFDLRVGRAQIDLTIDPARAALQETVTLTVEGSGPPQIVFAIDEGLVVKTSRANRGVVEHRQAGDALIVDVDPPLDGVRTFTFTIAGTPGRSSESAIGPDRVVLSPRTPWYPRLAGFWATTDVTIRTPAGWGAVAPGRPGARETRGTSRWITERPVRSIAVAAAPGLRVSESTVVSTPFRLASAGAGPAAGAVAERLAPAMAWLSGALAPYPFDSMNVVLLPGFSGRVEAGGLAILGRDAPLATDSDGADVLAGQWWGQWLGGDGAWIEGFAAWEGCVFARDRAIALPSSVTSLRAAYFALRSGDVALSRATAAAPAAVLRGKGSAAADMIRLVAGDRATFDAVRALFAAPVGPPIPLDRVRAAIEAQAGRSLARPFADWFDRPGAPEFEADLRTIPASGGGFRADVRLVQKRGAYALPVEVVLTGAGGERRETIEVAEEAISVFYVVPFAPSRIEIDPLDRIFRWK